MSEAAARYRESTIRGPYHHQVWQCEGLYSFNKPLENKTGKLLTIDLRKDCLDGIGTSYH